MKITKLAEQTRYISTAVTAVGFLVITFTIGALTVTKNHTALLNPSPDAESGEIPSFKSRATAAFDDDIVGFDSFLSIYGLTQRVLGTSVYEDAGYTYLIRDSEDFLHYHTEAADAQPYADAVIGLKNTLDGAGIPFVYLQAPTKEIADYTDYPPGIAYYSTQNASAMYDALTAGGVDVLSFADLFARDGIDPASQFYYTDHHWTTETAFTAFGYVVPYLNETRGWSLDTRLCELTSWTSLSQPQSFLGSIGRRLGRELSGLDDYTFYEPAFPTDYRVYYPPHSTTEPYWTGSFHDTLVRDSLLYAEDVAANRYATYFQYDYGELIIENLSADNDLHIAIIKDSFALPFTAFLSTAVGKIDMIDLREFEGSVTQHLLDTQPDLVLMLYSGGSFNAAMYQFEE